MKPIRVLLIGGGHAHIAVIRQRRALFPADSVEMVLVSPEPNTVYSGLMPAVVGGHYPVEECLINLPALCARYDVSWHQGAFQALLNGGAGDNKGPGGGERQSLLLADGSILEFDFASLDIGSEPGIAGIAGIQHGVGAKPANAFLDRWHCFVDDFGSVTPKALAVVGGGVAGVELMLAMRYRLAQKLGGTISQWQFNLVSAGPLLQGHNGWVRRKAIGALSEAGVEIRVGDRVVELRPDCVRLSSGETLPSAFTVLCTPAVPVRGLADSNLPLGPAGFVAVDAQLRMAGRRNLFAVGDVADFQPPLAKAGVYAVRQGPVLAANLAQAVAGGPLQAYTPQRRFLKLISLGGNRAIASRGWFYCSGEWVWRWKQAIDRRFMELYRK